MKKTKIALMYIGGNNLGDKVIFDTVDYLVKDILDKNKKEYEIVPVNIEIKKADVETLKYSKKRKNLYKKLNNLYDNLEKTVGKLFNLDLFLFDKRYDITKNHYYIEKFIIPKLKDVDVIVFCGGGLIKYHKQYFHHVLNAVTKYANKHHKKVIINSVGVEGYEENNIECKLLKKAINRKSVKAISTRDDIDSLINNYDKKKAVLVGDPALFCNEMYKVKAKKETKIKTIGINVIRPTIFKDYLYEMSEEELIKLYGDIAIKLLRQKYNVTFFTNGAIRDQELIDKILDNIKDLELKKQIKVDERPEETEKLIKMINSYDLVIGTRLHSNIIAASYNKPIIGIVWNIKQLLFAKIFNIEEYYITKDNFDSSYIVNKVNKALKSQKIDITSSKNKQYEFLEKALLKYVK